MAYLRRSIGTATGRTSDSPTLTTPALGTPSAGVLSSCTALPAAQVAQGTMASGMVMVAPALGTPASGTLTSCTFPFGKIVFSVRRTGDFDIGSDSWTLVPFSGTSTTEVFDTNSAFASSKFTVPSGEGGKYLLALNIGCDVGTTTGFLGTILHKNGSAIDWTITRHYCSASGGHPIAQVTHIVELSAADYIEPYMWQNGGTTRGGQSSSYFSGYKLSHL